MNRIRLYTWNQVFYVQVVGKNISGTVAENGWDEVSQTLKVFDVTGDFTKEDSAYAAQAANSE